MNKHDLVSQAQTILTRYVCRDLDGQSRVDMKQMVERFVAEHVSRMDKSEIMDRLATPMKALSWFAAYACEHLSRPCCTAADPASADTCQLA